MSFLDGGEGMKGTVATAKYTLPCWIFSVPTFPPPQERGRNDEMREKMGVHEKAGYRMRG